MGAFSGILLSESQYNDMVTWMNKEYPVTLTDDLGQASLVYLESLEYSRAPKPYTRVGSRLGAVRLQWNLAHSRWGHSSALLLTEAVLLM